MNLRWGRHSRNINLTGDGSPIERRRVTTAEASWSTNGEIHVYADDTDGTRLIWDMDINEARRLLVCLEVCVANTTASPARLV